MFSLAENDLGGLGGFRHDLPVIFSMSSGIPITSGFSISSSISIAGREKGSQPLRIRRITAYPCPEITGPGVLIFPPEKVLRYRKSGPRPDRGFHQCIIQKGKGSFEMFAAELAHGLIE